MCMTKPLCTATGTNAAEYQNTQVGVPGTGTLYRDPGSTATQIAGAATSSTTRVPGYCPSRNRDPWQSLSQYTCKHSDLFEWTTTIVLVVVHRPRYTSTTRSPRNSYLLQYPYQQLDPGPRLSHWLSTRLSALNLI
eukprot:1424636-Rhodomonas_salina.2